MYQREDINVGKLLKRLPKAIRSKVQAKEFLDECWTIFKKYDVFQSEKLEGCSLWKALLEALPEAFSQAILKNQYGWSLQQDSVYAFTGCGRGGEPAISLIKFPEYVKFTLALILHKYSANANVLDCKMALKPQELDHNKRKTKIVASLGPASWSEEMIPKMIEAGTDIFRLNCSHRRGGDFERVYPLIRKYSKILGRRVEVLGDLQGPKFRVGELEGEPVLLKEGEIVEFGICKDDNDLIKPGRITMKPTTEQLALVKACKAGIDLLIEDGIMKVNVVEKLSDTELKVKIIRGGKLKARKGVNVPDCEIDCAALTTKDIEDAEYLLQLEPPVEYICVSFAQKGQDLQELIDIMDRLNIPAEKRPKICPKIEKPQALTNIEGIIEKSQALMVARGDLGVELELERVPFAQKLLIARAKKAGLFVINATQMVESMIENPVPTRSEVCDLQNAVFDGADAVMLSGEAASGKFPLEAVRAEADAALEAEAVRDFLKPQVQGLEQGKFLQMRSFRVLAFPCLASLALVERRAWTCGDAFCGSWPHITNRRIASSVPRRGYYLSAELCVGWILNQENIEAWMYAHGVQSSEILSQGGDKEDYPSLELSDDSDEWVGDDGKGNVLPPDWLVKRDRDNRWPDEEITWFLTLRSASGSGLSATDLKALLADTDSMARGAALAADMGDTGPLKIIPVPSLI